MFEYSLENGKKQFADGLKFLIASIMIILIWGVAYGICVGTNSPKAALIVTLILVVISGIFLILALIKIIFGAVVYHAERTANKSAVDIKNIQSKEKEDEIKETILKEEQLKLKEEQLKKEEKSR